MGKKYPCESCGKFNCQCDKKYSSAASAGYAISVTHPSFLQGYFDGSDDPGFVKAIQPESVDNLYPVGSEDYFQYEAGYRAAIA